jgi:hypothetical protein
MKFSFHPDFPPDSSGFLKMAIHVDLESHQMPQQSLSLAGTRNPFFN